MIKKEIFTIIDDFIIDKNPGILVIKGKWGVGKTYIWNEYITSTRSNLSNINHYSYNSLFGINNISTVKQNIFQNLIKNENGFYDIKEIDISDYHIHKNIKNKKYRNKVSRKIPTFLTYLPQMTSYSELIIDSTFLSIKSPLICFDDFERRNEKLKVNEIFGLISFLKENKKAKVVLILNDLKMNEKTEYQEFKEKIIDIEIEYEPDIVSCMNVIFPKELKYDAIRENIKKLNINNIRIIKKIKYFYDILTENIKSEYQEISNIISHRLPILVSVHYSNINDIKIDLEYLLNIKNEIEDFEVKLLMNKNEDEENTKKENKVLRVLSEYEWGNSDYFDIFLSNTIKSGYVNREKYSNVLKNKEAEIIKNRNNNEFTEAWDMYHDSFNTNKTEVLNSLESGFKNNVNNITPLNFNGTILLFRDLNENEKASELIDYYIEKNRKDVIYADEYFIFDGISDEEIKTKIIQARDGDFDNLTFNEIIEKVINNKNINKKDIENLNDKTSEDFIKVFKEKTGKDLRLLIRRLLSYKNAENMEVNNVYKKVEEALKNIASESEINKRRVNKYGVSIE